MARLAIVIAVSENLPPLKSLKACARDGEAFTAVLRETGRFDEILVLTGKDDTASKAVKARVSALVDRYRGQLVEEVVFYYSGHGDFAGDEFYHILSDYEEKRRNQTTLTNSELDGLIRSLNPALFAKFVDACYSGMSYIKSADQLGDYLKSSNTGFRDVYFLYSSQGDEQSFTAGALSAFTKSILEAIAREASGPIRYRDLMSAASDYFAVQGSQKPQFVTQAGFTDVFCDASPQMQTAIAAYLPPPVAGPAPAPPVSVPPAPSKSLSLVERVKDAEEAYCSREEATAALERFADLLAAATVSPELAELFTLAVSRANDEPSDGETIGEWLKTPAARDYFAYAKHRTETYKKRVSKRTSLFDISRILSSSLLGDNETELIDDTREVVSGYRNSAALPFDSLTLRLEPLYRSLAPAECIVAPVISRSSARLYWSMRHYRYSDWDTAVPEDRAPAWTSEDLLLRDADAFARIAARIFQDFMAFTLRRVQARWPEPAPQPAPEPAKPPLLANGGKAPKGGS